MKLLEEKLDKKLEETMSQKEEALALRVAELVSGVWRKEKTVMVEGQPSLNSVHGGMCVISEASIEIL